MLELSIQKSLDHFELNIALVHQSGILVIQGASGSGKTTMLDCVAGLRKPDQGHIHLNGHTLYSHASAINLSTQKRHIGYVFQNYALFPHMTVMQNLLYGTSQGILSHFLSPGQARGRARLASSTQLTRWVDAFQLGHLLDKLPAQISGGERQRVALARALTVSPDLLLLDEPFSALDPITRHQVQHEFLDYSKSFGIPTLLVTHNAEEAALLGDRVILMAKGQLVENTISSDL